VRKKRESEWEGERKRVPAAPAQGWQSHSQLI